ncbi:MAG: hypothetical protein LPK19_02395, partial [Hymenobacteraceae bacterium]|nr:hypothetical protein [Hymenobacteraceae bacterium]MDX5395027.1 hypothetical protein [Hymenobacteraceae bacterium]MDX5511061.1 hypothetical protein [Hymenobacteraceae bacterium]
MASRTQFQQTLKKPYNRILFGTEVLKPVFGPALSLNANPVDAGIGITATETKVIEKVQIYGNIELEDGTEITCYEIVLQPKVKIDQSKVAIQQYVRKLLIAGQAALVNFVQPGNGDMWRLTLVAKDTEFTEEGIKEKPTHAKRYTYLVETGQDKTNKTLSERLEKLSISNLQFKDLVEAFSVEKLSKLFFDEYTEHYDCFVEHLNKAAFKKSVFNGDEKAIRDFAKKLLGRIVFLYFVQKKGWLGATTTEYKDGLPDFLMTLFNTSGGDAGFYSNWLSPLFFETLNRERKNDEFKMPDGRVVKIPFLNGGLFDKEKIDEAILTFKPALFHNPKNPDDPKHRGFLDFLDAFNFTVYEDSPDDHTVAVDPEMLGHIFENLLEDNKDK